ncbi:MAG: FAD-dependent oxidoreductase [Phycisphaeraceae bacterium]
MSHIAIVGAGMAGTTAARLLVEAGQRVTLFDKGTRPGGRMSTRELDDVSFDHGAQYITARTPSFTQALASWRQAGVIALWEARSMDWDGDLHPSDQKKTRWVGTPAMATILNHLQIGLDVEYGRAVDRIMKTDAGWSVRLDDGETRAGFSCLLISIPVEQTRRLLSDSGLSQTIDLGELHSQPCWTLLLSYEHSLALDFDAVRLTGHSCLGWLANNSSKLMRPSKGPECWVIQATEAWSRAHLEQTREQAAEQLQSTFEHFVSGFDHPLPEPLSSKAHRWRYAHIDRPAGQDRLTDTDLKLVVCGDWLRGRRVEDAYLSGASAADAALEMLGP